MPIYRYVHTIAVTIAVVALMTPIQPTAQFALAHDGRSTGPEIAPKVAGDHPSDDADWSNGLPLGPNGPIPFIVVDQFGYRTDAEKVAVIRSPARGYDAAHRYAPGKTFAVVDRASGKEVFVGNPVAWKNGAIDPVSGDKAWWFDFSVLTEPGTYVVIDKETGRRSVTFRIADDVYRGVLNHALRMFFYQRAGFAKSAESAGADWSDAASHLKAHQDGNARSWLAKNDESSARDLRGGWYDAGDYNKYTSWTARNIIILLRAYEDDPQAFGDDLGIPESGNGIPDILDEVKWGLDWLLRMQNADGGMLCVQALARASPPSAATGPSYYGPPTTSASLMGAAAFAYAAKIYGNPKAPMFRGFAQTLAERARQAWAWAEKYADVLFYNNDEQRQPGSEGLAAGQQEMTSEERHAAKFEAAVYLSELTNEQIFKRFVEANYAALVPAYELTQWESEQQDLLLYYARLPQTSPDMRKDIVARFTSSMTDSEVLLPMVLKKRDPYRAPIKDYYWGSNKSKAAEAQLFQLLARNTDDPARAAQARNAAEGFIHYVHGVNPLGLVYLTNMRIAGAEHSARTMFHFWFAHDSPRWSQVSDTSPGPPPGYLVAGPNPTYEPDACCLALGQRTQHRCGAADANRQCDRPLAPPRNQPPAKSYLQFNNDWPVNSWQVTEPSTGYQASFIRALAPFVK